MSNFILELSIIHLCLFLGYWLFLRKEKQYSKMRFYLLGSTLLAIIIPVLKLPNFGFWSSGMIENNLYATFEASDLETIAVTPAVETSAGIFGLLWWAYLATTSFLLLKFLFSVAQLINLRLRSSVELLNGFKIYRVKNIKGSFTFFGWIFLGESTDQNSHDYEIILKHEKAHSELRHSYDLIFFELFRAFFWWLPSAWIVNKEIRKIHEYQADAFALKSFNIDQYSSILISATLKSNGLSLASSFHDGLILKRLKAMKQQAKKINIWKLGVLGSLAIILFVVFACTEESGVSSDEIKSKVPQVESSTPKGEVFTIVEDQPKYPGGINALNDQINKEMVYPKEAIEKGIEGRVYVQFIVEKDGSITNVQPLRGIGAGCDKEAVRVVKSIISFTPGKQRGKAVRVRMVLPIEFKLSEGSDQTRTGMINAQDTEMQKEQLKVEATFSNGEWSGKVLTADGSELAGANLVVVGTTSGTVSDVDGTFKLKAHESQTIVVSFVGYETLKLARK